MKKYKNIVVTVSQYASIMLRDTLEEYGNKGYKLVNAVVANDTSNNKPVMYLFFTKEEEE